MFIHDATAKGVDFSLRELLRSVAPPGWGVATAASGQRYYLLHSNRHSRYAVRVYADEDIHRWGLQLRFAVVNKLTLKHEVKHEFEEPAGAIAAIVLMEAAEGEAA